MNSHGDHNGGRFGRARHRERRAGTSEGRDPRGGTGRSATAAGGDMSLPDPMGISPPTSDNSRS
ncbi:hypothetical protein Atai01_72540 [Amycolatopsis taiwanensis]|uniref:Uncharacterized protein n=1 Tax=Amycolatopsis taiwanensis TaxID=342230 RepID=A0A9W6R9B2_9PSEU|nr:hypothetical protein Atai01_72540 [Amycolatopsis taiwanensis]